MPRVISIVASDDWVPRCADAGYDTLIESLALCGYDENNFISEINEAGSQTPLNWPMFCKYLADRQMADALKSVGIYDAALPVGTARPDVPLGLGQDAASIWFSAPDKGTESVRWYVNGERKLRREQDTSADRSVKKSDLDALSGDIVQVCLENKGVVGWWARIEVD